MSNPTDPPAAPCAGLLLACAAGAVVWAAEARPVDTALPTRVQVGAAAGPSPMARLDAARSGSTTVPLPERPRLDWRARVVGGAHRGAVVDGRGNVIISTRGSSLVQLDPRGRLAWSARATEGSLVTGPALTASGTRVVQTSQGALLAVSPTGDETREVSLRVRPGAAASELLPTGDGGLVASAGAIATWLRHDLSELGRATLPESIAGTVARAGHVLLVTERGAVFEWAPPAPPRRLGSFGGATPTGAVLSSPRHLSAVVDGALLVDLNLSTETRPVRLSSLQRLDGPPTVLPSGEAFVTTDDGLLLGFDRAGRETARVSLEPPRVDAPASPLAGAPSPAPIVDAKRRIAFVRPGLEVGVVLPSGVVHFAEGAACHDPESLVVAGRQRLLLTCSSGQVFAIASR